MDINPWSSITFWRRQYIWNLSLNRIPEKCSETENLMQNYEIAYKNKNPRDVRYGIRTQYPMHFFLGVFNF